MIFGQAAWLAASGSHALINNKPARLLAFWWAPSANSAEGAKNHPDARDDVDNHQRQHNHKRGDIAYTTLNPDSRAIYQV